MNSESQPTYCGRSTLMIAMGLCAVLIAIAVGREFGLIGGEFGKRAVGMMIGAVLIVTGNVLPKFVLPLRIRAQHPAQAMATERFAGWTFFLTGFVFVLVWLFAPIEYVKVVSSAFGLGAFLIVLTVWARALHRMKVDVGSDHEHPYLTPGPETSDALFTPAQAGRNGVFTLLHAVFWVFLIFIADSIWGDRVAQWLAVVFVVVSGVLVAGLTSQRRNREPPLPGHAGEK